MLWCIAKPGWRGRLVTSASWDAPVGLTKRLSCRPRPAQHRGKYQFEDQRSALDTMVNTTSATLNVYDDQVRQATRCLIPPSHGRCSLASP